MGNSLFKESKEASYNPYNLFSKDPPFEKYYITNKRYFSRHNSDSASSVIDELANNNENCLGCFFFLETKKEIKKVVWFHFFKDQCIKLQGKHKWAKILTNFLKKINDKNMEEYVKKYIIDLYYIDYKTEIFEQDEESKMESNQNKDINFNFVDNSPIITVNSESSEFSPEKIIYSKNVFYNYSENMSYTLDNKSNDYPPSRKFPFLRNNSLMSQNKLNDFIREGDASLVINQSFLHQKTLNHYKLITNVIEKHISISKGHPLAKIKQLFLEFFFKEYKKYSVQTFFNAVYDIQQIIRLLAEDIILFYNLSEYRKFLKNFFFFTKENIIAFVTCVIFNEAGIYEILMNFQKQHEQILEENVEKAIKKFSDWSPEDFGVSIKYSLTEKTVNYLKQKKKDLIRLSNYSESSYLEKKNSLDENFFCDDYNNFYGTPFLVAIENLKIIEKLKSPIHKLKTISRVVLSILENIKDFYKELDEVFEEKIIEPDEIINIFMFIVCKAKVQSLYSQCVLLERFLTNQVISSIPAYNLANLKAALYLLSNKE